MSQSNGPENERMERMLRQWGAEEAARRESASAPPAPVARSGPSMVWRYAPLAAAAVLLAVAINIYMSSRGADSTSPNAEMASLAQAQADLKASREALASAQASLADERRQADAEITAVRAAADAERKRQQEAVDKLSADLVQAKADHEAQLRTMATLAKAQDEVLAKLKGQMEEQSLQLAATAKQYVEAKADTDRLTARLKADNELFANLKAELAEAQALCSTLQGLLGHEAAAGNRTPAQQQAEARSRDLIRRGAVLRAETSDPELRRLIDTVDFLLTHLATIDPANPSDLNMHTWFLRQADLPHRINQIVSRGNAGHPLQTWLVEAEGILLGSGHAL